MMSDLNFWIVVILLGFVGTPILGLVLKWVDRLVTARIQWRKGPPPYQTFADILKLLGKETLVSERASAPVFLLAPVLGFIGAGVAASLLWAVALRPEAGFGGDLIVVIYFLVLPALGIILGASASGSPHAGQGAGREMKMVIAYELPFILAMVPAILAAGGTFRLSAIVSAQSGSVLLWSISGFIAFVCTLAVVQAKLGVVPFDQAEAETELMGGVILEYSGPPLALILVVRAMLLFVLPMFVITVFWGGIALSGLGLLLTVVKLVVLLVVIVLVRNTCPRIRIDQTMKFFWYMVTPVAVIACWLALLGARG